MKKEQTIKFSWWNDNDNKIEIPVIDQEQLEEHAKNRINNMTIEGYTSGELIATVNGNNYLGHWEMTTKTL